MRSIGRLDDERQAATFVDYLLTQGISAKAERNETPSSPTTWELWIFDEDRRAAAKESLEAFRAEPEAEHFRSATKEAEKLRRAEIDREFELRRKQREFNRASRPGGSGRRPITMALLIVSCLVFLLTDGGSARSGDALRQKLSITSYEPVGDGVYQYSSTLLDVREGEWWRIVTPIFLHFGLIHLVFNMLCLMDFGTQIETLRGSRKMLFFTLLFAAAGNLVQFKMEGPLFGGMSGVVYGLFGYVLMKSHFEPESGLFVRPSAAVSLIVWFAVGVLYDVVPIIKMANYCHGVGLLMGLATGYAPTFFRSLRKTK